MWLQEFNFTSVSLNFHLDFVNERLCIKQLLVGIVGILECTLNAVLALNQAFKAYSASHTKYMEWTDSAGQGPSLLWLKCPVSLPKPYTSERQYCIWESIGMAKKMSPPCWKQPIRFPPILLHKHCIEINRGMGVLFISSLNFQGYFLPISLFLFSCPLFLFVTL